jgi:transcription antitermination factor NusG
VEKSANNIKVEGKENIEIARDFENVMEPWKLVYCASRQEKKVSAYLAQRDIEHYLPLVKSLRFWKDRKKWVEMPLFNGYLFVRPSEIQRDMVLTVSGVVKYIRYNGKDALVPAEQVQLIKRLIEKGYQMERYEGDVDLERGDIAEVLDGVFRGQEVEVFHNSEREESYILVTLDAANHRIKVTLPREILKLKIKSKNRKDNILR